MSGDSKQSTWPRLKASAASALELLSEALGASEEIPQDLFDAYLYAKRSLADAMQAFAREHLPADGARVFHELRERISAAAKARFSGEVPERYLQVPYGSRTHTELFSLLYQHQGSPVSAGKLRVITADSVHTERRMRELRELGLDIQAAKSLGGDVYVLRSLGVDDSYLESIVVNNIKRDKKLPAADRSKLLDSVSGAPLPAARAEGPATASERLDG